MARIKSKEDFMKRKIILILLGAFLATSVFANGLKGKIPADMGKSLIISQTKFLELIKQSMIFLLENHHPTLL